MFCCWCSSIVEMIFLLCLWFVVVVVVWFGLWCLFDFCLGLISLLFCLVCVIILLRMGVFLWWYLVVLWWLFVWFLGLVDRVFGFCVRLLVFCFLVCWGFGLWLSGLCLFVCWFWFGWDCWGVFVVFVVVWLFVWLFGCYYCGCFVFWWI